MKLVRYLTTILFGVKQTYEEVALLIFLLQYHNFVTEYYQNI